MALPRGTQTMAVLNSHQEGQPYPASTAPPARGPLAVRSQRSAYTTTNCDSQNASGRAASASVPKDGPFPRSPREISASRYPSRSAGQRGRGLGASANQSRSRSLHGNQLRRLLQRCSGCGRPLRALWDWCARAAASGCDPPGPGRERQCEKLTDTRELWSSAEAVSSKLVAKSHF